MPAEKHTPLTGSTLRSWLYHVVALSVVAVFVLPFIWVISASLRQPGLPPPKTIEWLPSPIVWSNYTRIFQLVPLDHYALNSLIVAGLAVPLTIITASWAGFAMARQPIHLTRHLIIIALLLLMVPSTALWLTRFVLFTQFGLVDTLWALLAPAFMGTSPLFVLLFYWAFRRIPPELFESAHLDGANAWQIWAWIALPLVRPTIIAVGVLTFSLYWSDFINPLLYLKTEQNYTLAIGLQTLQQMDRTNWPLLMAASVVMTAPMVIIVLLGQHFYWSDDRSGIGH